MGYEALTEDEIAVGKPGRNELFAKMKANFDYLYGLIGAGNIAGIIPNASFEIDSDEDGVPDQWTKNLYAGGAGGYETSDVIHGAKAYKFTHPGGAGNGGGYLTSDYIEAAGGTHLAVLFWLKTNNAAIKVQGVVACYDKDKIYISTQIFYSSVSNPTSWAQRYGAASLPAGTRYIKIQLQGGTDDVNQPGVVYFDYVEFLIVEQKIEDGATTESKIGAAAVSQVKLKTSTGSVSTYLTAGQNLTLPGGTYGFYPQIKVLNHNYPGNAQLGQNIGSESYVTNIWLRAGYLSPSMAIYAQQRYVTASGKDSWLFILYDKKEKQIVSTWYAPDHPSYGQGGDEKKLPHPFPDYFKKEPPDNCEIILIDLAQTKELEKRQTSNRTVSEIVMEEYVVDDSKIYKFEKRDVSNEKGEHRYIEKTPEFIKVRKLLPKEQRAGEE